MNLFDHELFFYRAELLSKYISSKIAISLFTNNYIPLTFDYVFIMKIVNAVLNVLRFEMRKFVG